MKKAFHFLFALLNWKRNVSLTILISVFAGSFHKSIAQSYVIDGSTYSACGLSETITAPFISPDGEVTTNQYSGFVLVTVSGTGFSYGNDINDAFYNYRSSPPDHQEKWQFGITLKSSIYNSIDDVAYQHIVYDVIAGMEVTPPYVPAYQADNTYKFIIDLNTLVPSPASSTILRFGVVDDGYEDNGGEYMVQVTQLCCPSGGVGSFFYRDADEDGYGDSSLKKYACTKPGGYVANNSDCDDGNAALNPETKWYKDADGDGYSDGAMYTQCLQPTNYKLASALTATSGDCNDDDANFNPGTVWIVDNDKDGYYPGDPVTRCASPGTGYIIKTTQQPGDCNDNDAAVHSLQTYYLDFDKDGYGDPGKIISVCSLKPPAGYVTNNKDCNDGDAAISPVAVQVCGSRIDDNCNGVIDEKTCYPCQNATNLNASNITAYTAQLSWRATANPQQWELEYKSIAKGSKWINVLLTGNIRSVTITGLLAKQSYIWRVHAKCNRKWTDYSGPVGFTTAHASIAARSAQQSISGMQTGEENERIKLYPNPTRGQFRIELQLAREISTNAKIELLNLTGQTVLTENAYINHGTLYINVDILPSLSTGIYIARITVNNETYATRLIYEK